MVLLGEPGSPFRNLCEDLASFESDYQERFAYFQPETFTEDGLLQQMNQAVKDGAGRFTAVLQEINNLDQSMRDRLVALLKREAPFDHPSLLARIVFCSHQDIDALFDAGVIDDRLYVLMGAAELRVPPLRSIPDDIPILAKRLLNEYSRNRGLSYIPQLAPAALSALLEKEVAREL